MSKQKPPNMITDNIAEHPAVLAWSQLRADLLQPRTIEVVREVNTTQANIYRLIGAGENESSVIAKRTEKSTLEIEKCIYEEALMYLSERKLHYYGYVEPAGELPWIFIEDAGGTSFSFKNKRHTSLATDWLAGLHTSVPRLSSLPVRGMDYYYSVLLDSHDRIRENLTDKTLLTFDLEVLKSIVFHFDVLEQNWNTVCGLYDELPKGLIHGDFKAKNMRVRSDSKGSVLLVFDWEIAGWGLPGIDMWKLDLKDYWLKVCDHWNGITLDKIRYLSSTGKLLWCLKAIEWEVESLASQGGERAMDRMEIYAENLSNAIREIL